MTQPGGIVHAPEFPTGLTWYNTSQPLTLAGLRGKVVLLDFWTYCCINCMHVLPDLKYLEEKFADAPFQVIGVHCAKFPNEKVDHHVRHAILRYGVQHPVVVDPDFSVWQRFAVRAWPTLVVVDPVGYIVGHLPGEGHRGQIEEYLRQALPQYRAQGVVREGGAPMHVERDASRPVPHPNATLSYPGKLTADPADGTLWIADSGHHQLVEARKDGMVLRRIGSGQPGLADGEPDSAGFRDSQGLFVAGRTLYVADTGNHAVRAVDLESGKVSTVAGTGKQSTFGARGGPAQQSPLNSPWDLTHREGVLYIAMAGSHQLWRLDLARRWAEPHAGAGREEIIDGPNAQAALAQPSGIALLGDKLVFADSEVSALRIAGVQPGGSVKTLVGEGLFRFGDRDGKKGEAQLQHPLGVAVHEGWIYVADTYNHKIKVWHTEQGVLKTLAGTGQAGWADGPLEKARFFEPGGLAFLDGQFYVADTNNHAVRRIDLASGTVETVTLT